MKKRVTLILLCLLLPVLLFSGCDDKLEPTFPSYTPSETSQPVLPEISAFFGGKEPEHVVAEDMDSTQLVFALQPGEAELARQYIDLLLSGRFALEIMDQEVLEMEGVRSDTWYLTYTGPGDVGNLITEDQGSCQVYACLIEGETEGKFFVGFAGGFALEDLGDRGEPVTGPQMHIIPDVCAFLETATPLAQQSGDGYRIVKYGLAPGEEILARNYLETLVNDYGLEYVSQKNTHGETGWYEEYCLRSTVNPDLPGFDADGENCHILALILTNRDLSDGTLYLYFSDAFQHADTGDRPQVTAAETPVLDFGTFINGRFPQERTTTASGSLEYEYHLQAGEEELVAQYAQRLNGSGGMKLVYQEDDEDQYTWSTTYYFRYNGKNTVGTLNKGDHTSQVFIRVTSRKDLGNVKVQVCYAEGLQPRDTGLRADDSKVRTPIADISTFLSHRNVSKQETLTYGSTRMELRLKAGETVLIEQYINHVKSHSDYFVLRETVTDKFSDCTIVHYYLEYTGPHDMMDINIKGNDGKQRSCNLYIACQQNNDNSSGVLTMIYSKHFQRVDTGARADFSKVVKPAPITSPGGNSGNSGGSGGSGGKTVDVLDRQDCPACFRGSCRHCEGGYYYEFLPGERKRVKQNCTKCVGGACSTCNGSGWL